MSQEDMILRRSCTRASIWVPACDSKPCSAAGGARVLQINGTMRDVFYYPEGTVSVRVVGPDVNIGVLQPTPKP